MKTALYCIHRLPQAVDDVMLTMEGFKKLYILSDDNAALTNEVVKALTVFAHMGIEVEVCGFDDMPEHNYAVLCEQCWARLLGQEQEGGA